MIARTLVTALFLCLGGLVFFAHGAVRTLSSDALGNASDQPQALFASVAPPEARGLVPVRASLGVAGLDVVGGERIWPFAREEASAPSPRQRGAAARSQPDSGWLSSVGRGLASFALGLDHVLFALCLLWLAASARTAVAVLTAFTAGLALSVTLVALDVIHVPPRFAEVMVALSLVWMGGSVLLEKRADVQLAWPAVGFGLIHGLGFAQALRGAGLLPHDAPAALLGLNLGVELGLLVLAALAWLLVRGLAAVAGRHRVEWMGAYAVACVAGSLGVYWALSHAGLG